MSNQYGTTSLRSRSSCHLLSTLGLVVIVIIGLLFFTSCSVKRNNIFSKSYHNTTARYNSYFIAKEEIKASETQIWEGHKDNYHKVLTIFPEHAEMSSSLAGSMDKAIKYASLPIQWHENSKWVDDSYILIGKARFYKEDYENSIKTFKYVNGQYKEGQNPQDRYEALSWLARAYTYTGEFRSAEVTLNILDKAFQEEDLNRKNNRLYHLNKAYLAYERKEWEQVEKEVGEAIPFINAREDRARYYFIIGQIRKKKNDFAGAEKSFKSVLVNNPDYQLMLESRLALAEVTSGENEKEIRQLKNFFQKTLRDEKNKDLKNRVFYAWASLEYRLDSVELALALFDSAVHSPGKDPNTKGYAYLAMGNIYYNDYEDYEKAHLYQDSAFNNLSQDLEEYPSIKRRNIILANLWKHYKIYQGFKEARRFSEMSEAELEAYISKEVEEKFLEEKERIKEEKKQKRKKNLTGGYQSSMAFFDPTKAGGIGSNQSGSDGWYFDNETQLARGREDFKRVWGDRLLQDNWRFVKTAVQEEEPITPEPQEEPQEPDVEAQTAKDSKAKGAALTNTETVPSGKEKVESDEEIKARLRIAVEATIPKEEEAEPTSDLDTAMYHVGSIFRHKLLEKRKAKKIYEEYLTLFQDELRAAEVAYALYIMYRGDKENQQRIARWILEHHPKSEYAGLIEDPDYRSKYRRINERVAQLYKQAFDLYKQERYAETVMAIDAIREEYPKNEYNDKIDLLRIMVVGHTLPVGHYLSQLQGFDEKYPKSDLLPYVENLYQTALESRNKKKEKPAEQPTEDQKYRIDKVDKHQFIAVLPLGKVPVNTIKNQISNFNKTFYDTEQLFIKDMIMGTQHIVVLVKGLRSKIMAESYFEKITSSQGVFKHPVNGIETYLITEENFLTFFQEEDMKEYGVFFKANYEIQKEG